MNIAKKSYNTMFDYISGGQTMYYMWLIKTEMLAK